jgi:hypothetical protein
MPRVEPGKMALPPENKNLKGKARNYKAACGENLLYKISLS